MATVKVKKSILDKLIKKTLFESDSMEAKSSDTTIPKELPVKANNLITDQQESEAPPVGDEKYEPVNQKELGNAMRALVSSVPTSKVGETYKALKRTLEQYQGSDEVNESRKRRKIVQQFLKEALDDYKPVDDFDDKNFKGFYDDEESDDLGSEDEDEKAASKPAARSKNFFDDNERKLISPFIANLSDEQADGVIDIIEVIFLDPSRQAALTELMELMNARAYLFDLKTQTKSLAVDSRNEQRVRGLVNYAYEQIKEFILLMKNKLVNVATTSGAEPDREDVNSIVRSFNDVYEDIKEEIVKIEALTVDKSGQWRQLKTTFGYSAESGIRQGTIKDILGVRGVQQIWTDEFKDELVGKIDQVWYECINNPVNAKFFAALLSDETNGYKELFRLFNSKKAQTLEFLKKESLIYRNFMGILTYQISGKIADMKFGQPTESGITPGRYMQMINTNRYLRSGKRSVEDINDIYRLKTSGLLNDRQLKTFFKFLKITPDIDKILKKLESPTMDEKSSAEYIKQIAAKADDFSTVETGRDITLSFQSDFPENKPITDKEREILEKMLIDEGGLDNAVDEVLEAAAEDDYRGTFTGAAILSGQDVDAEDAAWAANEADVNIKHPAIYETPAFASFKKAAVAGKNPDYLMKQMLEPSKIAKADDTIGAVKGSLKDIEKAKKAAAKKGK